MNQTASDLAGVFPEADDLERLGVLLQSDLDIPLAQLAEVVAADGVDDVGDAAHVGDGVVARGVGGVDDGRMATRRCCG